MRWVLLLVLALVGCAGQPPVGQQVEQFVASHTACNPTGYSSPRWSADGTRVIYGVSRGAKNSIRWADASGGDDHQLVDDAFAPVPSPDGRWLLYLTTNQPGGTGPDSTLLDLSTMKPQTLAGYIGSAVSWSPDSQWIAYNLPGGPLIKVNVETGEPVTLLDDPTEKSYDFTPQWSPDGAQILFVAGDGPDQALNVVRADGSGLTQLASLFDPSCTTNSGILQQFATWNPDGESIIFSRVCGTDIRMHTITLNGQQSLVTFTTPLTAATMIWSPDRTQFLLLDLTGNPTLLTVSDADGSGPVQLWQGAWDADWSPDGSLIAFVGDDGNGLTQIYVINPDGTGLTQLTDNPGMGGICLH